MYFFNCVFIELCALFVSTIAIAGPPYASTDKSVAAQKWRALQYRDEERRKKEQQKQEQQTASSAVAAAATTAGGSGGAVVSIAAMRKAAQEEQQRKQREEADKIIETLRQKEVKKKGKK